MKSILFVFFTMILLHTNAQTKADSRDANNAVHDRFDVLYHASINVVLPDSVFTALKNFAFSKGYPEAGVLKNRYSLQIIYNNNLSIADRLFACEFLADIYKLPETYVPLFIVTDMKKSLTSKNKADL